MKTQHQPYTYFIGWIAQQKYYYGVRYAKNCFPADFWVVYFTSSNEVKAMRLIYGDPDIIQIRKKFISIDQARIWENTVLRRMKVVKRTDFLNKNDAPAPPINNRIMSEDTKEKIRAVHKGKPLSEEHKQKIKEARAKQDMSYRKGIPLKEETKKKIRVARAKQITTDETRKKISESMRGERHWSYGKPMAEETKQKIKEARAKQDMSYRKGIPLTEEHKQKIREARLKQITTDETRKKNE